MLYDAIIVGGGASGVFYAANITRYHRSAKVLLLEKTSKLLSKVKVSGGGRCNVTNSIAKPYELVKNYPRGGKKIQSVLQAFGCFDTIHWFEERGVPLKTEADGRVFPVSNNSDSIIQCLLKECRSNLVELKTNAPVIAIRKDDDVFSVQTKENTYSAKNIFIATGGQSSLKSFKWLKDFGLEIILPVPSLFTFNIPDSPLQGLQGIAVEQAHIKIAGTKLAEQGPLLITHWGISGPAVLRLSAWGARILHEHNYEAEALVNWVGNMGEEEVRSHLNSFEMANPKKKVVNHALFAIPARLWERFCSLCLKETDKTWEALSKKEINRLVNMLTNMPLMVKGKTTFKEEFVTCGGIALHEIDLNTMESKKVKGLFFGGEILDIDGITGGFNFQSAWACAILAAKNLKM